MPNDRLTITVSFGSTRTNKIIIEIVIQPLAINSINGWIPFAINVATSDKIFFPRSALLRDKNQL